MKTADFQQLTLTIRRVIAAVLWRRPPKCRAAEN